MKKYVIIGLDNIIKEKSENNFREIINRFGVFFLSFVFFVLSFIYTRINTLPVETFSHIVKQMGYEDVCETPYEIVEISIPEEFNDVYIRYNNLLKKEGYDLSSYKGKKCKRYTYLIPSQNARANIIVYKGKVVGGDISSITIDGIMLPIKGNEEDS